MAARPAGAAAAAAAHAAAAGHPAAKHAPGRGAPSAGITTAGATTAGATTTGGPTGAPGDRPFKDFAETLTSEFQAVGDQSQGMHDDPRQAYQSRKSYLLFIEIIMAVCVIALIVGTVVMFVVSSNSSSITLKSEPATTQSTEASTTSTQAAQVNPNTSHALILEEGDYASASPT